MTIFYAYIQSVRDSSFDRYFITCANQETANQWWRAIEALAEKGTTGYKDVRRVATQMYSYDKDTLNLCDTTKLDKPLAQFAGRVFYTLLPNWDHQGSTRVSQLPPPPHRDPINGERYFIRSRSAPHLYWVKSPDSDTIVASTHARTAFKIERSNGKHSGQRGSVSDVIVDDDDIYIILGLKLGKYVSNDKDNFLTISGRGYSYNFGDFKNNFATWDSTTEGAANWSETGDGSNPKNCQVRVLSSENSGYGWELV